MEIKQKKKKKLKNENNKKDTNFTITNNKINELAKLKEEKRNENDYLV